MYISSYVQKVSPHNSIGLYVCLYFTRRMVIERSRLRLEDVSTVDVSQVTKEVQLVFTRYLIGTIGTNFKIIVFLLTTHTLLLYALK